MPRIKTGRPPLKAEKKKITLSISLGLKDIEKLDALTEILDTSGRSETLRQLIQEREI